jgi:hypothetical protein
MSRGPQVHRHGVSRVRRLEYGPGGPIFSSVQPIYQQQQHPSHQPGPEVAVSLAPRGNESGYHGMCHSVF